MKYWQWQGPRWMPAALALVVIVLAVVFFGRYLIAVRTDAAAMSSVLRNLAEVAGWPVVFSSAVGGLVGWVFRSTLIESSTAAFGAVAGFWLTWLSVNTAALLIFIVSRYSLADYMDAWPGPGQKINAFVRRWAIPLVAFIGAVPAPFPMTFVVLMTATAKMSYGRFLLPYAVGTAAGIGVNLYSGGSALADPDLPWWRILVLLLLPLLLLPLPPLVGKLINRFRESRTR